MMKYVILRNGWYHYSRHVPVYLKEFDARDKVRISLDTKCPKTALKKSIIVNDEVENYWEELVKTNSTHNHQDFKNLVLASKQLGFRYIPSIKLAEQEIKEIVSRLLFVDKTNHNSLVTNALLGKEQPKKITLSKALKRYWKYTKPLLIDKNSNQRRKWENPRKKAVNNFIKVVGDKDISELVNLDILKLRDWWLMRIQNQDMKPETANKDFTHLRGIIKTVATHEQMEIDVDAIFKDIYLPKGNTNTRLPFESDYIVNELFDDKRLQDIEEEAKYILYALAETGARPQELLNLDGEKDIILDVPIPYIHIRPRKGYSLKTKVSERRLPLIGFALEAFKKYPKGFIKYYGKSDQFSTYINGFLLERKLRPTLNHTLYSLRHSFQDRLTALEIPDRIQCQLMGHSFEAKGRTKYGSGATLEHMLSVMKRVCL
ncbi:tyrosine-type recombinase/integrase [Flavobacteriaceae bacterium MHTCC 0001]